MTVSQSHEDVTVTDEVTGFVEVTVEVSPPASTGTSGGEITVTLESDLSSAGPATTAVVTTGHVVDVIVTEPPVIEISAEGEQGIQGPTGGSGPPGPPGPEGPEGPAGPGTINQLYGFATPSTLWIINHNLGMLNLSVVTEDNLGEVIEGDVEYVDSDTITIDWYYPTVGTARIFN